MLILAPMDRGEAGETLVAVAANVAQALPDIGRAFEAHDGHRMTFTIGSTGKLYAQIIRGAPFDILLAADQARPARLVASGHAVPSSQFTYALGRLSVWTSEVGLAPEAVRQRLRDGEFRRLAIANPALAPYGVAAEDALQHLGILDRTQARLVMGQNVGQAFSLVATGNADLGLVARALVDGRDGSRWDIPSALHRPIAQDAVLLTRALSNDAANDFMAFLVSNDARAIFHRFGYGVD